MVPRLAAAVVVPTHNGVDHVAGAVGSIELSAAVADHDVEVVAVDDGSTDDTIGVLDEIRQRCSIPMTIVAHHRNRGPAAARNTGVRAIDADAYLFLDQDDEYLPDHLRICLDVLARQPRLDYVRTGVVLDRPVHPHWQDAIAASLVQTLAVRPFAHRFVGGFIEDPAVAVHGNEDVFYSRLLRYHLHGLRRPEATVWYHEHPGNAFARQWERKFSRPPEDAEPTLTGARLEAAPAAQLAFQRRVLEVERRARRLRGTSRRVV
jgi:glycosyltransferase involved in cell wall biosynthesis